MVFTQRDCRGIVSTVRVLCEPHTHTGPGTVIYRVAVEVIEMRKQNTKEPKSIKPNLKKSKIKNETKTFCHVAHKES